MKQLVSIIGNLGKDPEMRYLPDGSAVTNMSVATNRRWTQDGERKEEVTWWRVSVFGRQAEACNEYLEKGRLVSVDGRIIPDPNTGGPRLFQRQDGTVGAAFEIRASSVTFLGGSGDASPAGGAGYASSQASGHRDAYGEEEDEIPF